MTRVSQAESRRYQIEQQQQRLKHYRDNKTQKHEKVHIYNRFVHLSQRLADERWSTVEFVYMLKNM